VANNCKLWIYLQPLHQILLPQHLQTQIQLNWTNNAANNNVIIAYNMSNTFGTPTDGASYSVNNAISGGGTVVFTGSYLLPVII
jgi:hypothetical protein